MNKTLIVCAVAGILGTFACKKDNKIVTVTETVHDTINTFIPVNGKVDPDALSAAISINNGTKTDGTFPAPSADADAPALDTMYSRMYEVVEGGEMKIYPPNLKGNVAGYYVQITGAKSYFKVTTAEAPITLTLPMDIKGDTFYVKYAAFDAQNRVSAAVTGVGIILPQGDATFISKLNGHWKYAGRKIGYVRDTETPWEIDTFDVRRETYFRCENDKLVESQDPGTTLITLGGMRIYWDLSFDNNKYTADCGAQTTDLNRDLSTCNNLVYTYYDEMTTKEWGYTSYDVNTRILHLIIDARSFSSPIFYIYSQFYVMELTDHKLVLVGVPSANLNNTVHHYVFYK